MHLLQMATFFGLRWQFLFKELCLEFFHTHLCEMIMQARVFYSSSVQSVGLGTVLRAFPSNVYTGLSFASIFCSNVRLGTVSHKSPSIAYAGMSFIFC